MFMPVTAFSQAGSTGGSVGQQDKSVSGGGTTKMHLPAPHVTVGSRANMGCGRIVGAWTWSASGLSWKIVVKQNGIATHSIDNGISGTWSCKGENYVFVWANGKYLDHVTLLSPNVLEGTNINGIKFAGTREAP
jgi:hypothetical protein